MNHTISMFECPSCGHVKRDHSWAYDAYEGKPLCGDCGEFVKHSHERPALWVSVALFVRSREYGGPEEGGWWYDRHDLDTSTIRCFGAGDIPAAEQYCELLAMRNAEHHETNIRVFKEELPLSKLPRHRPVYC